MPEQPPLVRQWILLRLLSSRRLGLTVREAAEELGVNQRTIRRDLQCFEQAGFPLEEIGQGHGRKAWRLLPGASQQPLGFAYDEALALYLGRRFLEPLAGTPFWEASQQAHRKIRATLGEGALKYVEQFANVFHQTAVGGGDYSKKADVIDALMVGIEESKAVFITYQSLQATEPVTYDIYPFGLVYHRGSLYLVGRAVQDGTIRHWKLDRMTGAEVTPVPFQRPKDFDLAEHLKGSFGVFHVDGDEELTVRVRFSVAVARYVQEGHWHPSQELAVQKDGSVIAEFQLSNTEEIKRWLLSFGRHAEVLEPEELRRSLADEMEAMAGVYGGGNMPTKHSGTASRARPIQRPSAR